MKLTSVLLATLLLTACGTAPVTVPDDVPVVVETAEGERTAEERFSGPDRHIITRFRWGYYPPSVLLTYNHAGNPVPIEIRIATFEHPDYENPTGRAVAFQSDGVVETEDFKLWQEDPDLLYCAKSIRVAAIWYDGVVMDPVVWWFRNFIKSPITIDPQRCTRR